MSGRRKIKRKEQNQNVLYSNVNGHKKSPFHQQLEQNSIEMSDYIEAEPEDQLEKMKMNIGIENSSYQNAQPEQKKQKTFSVKDLIWQYVELLQKIVCFIFLIIVAINQKNSLSKYLEYIYQEKELIDQQDKTQDEQKQNDFNISFKYFSKFIFGFKIFLCVNIVFLIFHLISELIISYLMKQELLKNMKENLKQKKQEDSNSNDIIDTSMDRSSILNNSDLDSPFSRNQLAILVLNYVFKSLNSLIMLLWWSISILISFLNFRVEQQYLKLVDKNDFHYKSVITSSQYAMWIIPSTILISVIIFLLQYLQEQKKTAGELMLKEKNNYGLA